jgi:hypothetical protein
VAGYTPPQIDGQRRRRNAQPGTRMLPAEGFTGPTPEFPIEGATPAELRRWARLWKLPQAAAWDALEMHTAVARYTRAVLEAEQPGAPVTLLEAVRRMEDTLGLSPWSLMKLRWLIVRDEPEQSDAEAVARRRRIRPVDPEAAS